MTLRVRLLGCFALLLVVLGAKSAHALTFSYCDFSNLSTWTLNGSARQSGTLLQLTSNASNLTGTAYRTSPVAWSTSTNFHAFMRIQILPNGGNGADGMAFILQNTGVNAVGTGGGGIGYEGIANSVEVEFDIFQNSWDPNNNHVGIMSAGDQTTHLAFGTPGFTMTNGGVLYAWIDYVAATTTMSVYIARTNTKPAVPIAQTTINVAAQLGAQAFVGFTAATGGSPHIDEHDALELEFSTDGQPCSCEGNAGCGGTTPICDVSGTCRGCTAADCTGATPVCAPPGDPKAGQCVMCAANGNCDANLNTATPICDKSGGALTDSCRACAMSSECTAPLQPVCETTGTHLGQCAQCASNADCVGNPAGPVCFDNGTTEVCVQCTSNANCGGTTPVCNTSLHTCGPCASDADCSVPTPVCQTSGPLQGACTQCSATETMQCMGTMPMCDPATGTCVGCLTNANCAGADPICDQTSHLCRPCQSNTDCTGMMGTPACATSGPKQGQCVACATNSDCSGATPVCNPATNTCVGCIANSDCGGTTPLCNPMTNVCVGCITNSDCSGNTPTCDATTHTCRACMSDMDCTVPTPACQTGGALKGDCTQCSQSNHSQCMGNQPVCVTSVGECGCNFTSDCPSGEVCNSGLPPAGKCVPGPDGGVDAGMDASPTEGGTNDGGDAGRSDAAPPVDSGPPPEAGNRDSGVGGFDASPSDSGSAEGGVVNPEGGDFAGGGCSCTTAGAAGGSGAVGLAGLLLAAFAWVGRTGRRRRS